MNPRLKALHNKLQAAIDEGKGLQALDSHDETQAERYAAIPKEIHDLRAEIVNETKATEAFSEALSQGNQFLNGSADSLRSVAADLKFKEDEKSFKTIRGLRSRARFFTKLAERSGESRAWAQQEAYRFGQFLAATILPGAHPMRAKALKYCKENGIEIVAAAHSESDPEHGAALVIPEFENSMIDLREMFGLYRQYARYTPMGSETKTRPRRKGGLVAYHVGSSQAAAESSAKWDDVNLVAKKIMVLAKYESEIGEDAMMDFGDLMAGEMAYACAVREDQDGFIGDGTSDYGGIEGVGPKLERIYGTGGGVGLVLGAGNLWSELTLANFQKIKGQVPEYAELQGDMAWYCHKTFFETVMAPIALAAGGVTAAEIVAGVRRQFLGYPVRITQTMPNVEANSQVPVFFGALEMSSDFGDRRATTIRFSDQVAFTTDEIVARCTERFDINNHDVGDVTTPGPIVGLITAAA